MTNKAKTWCKVFGILLCICGVVLPLGMFACRLMTYQQKYVEPIEQAQHTDSLHYIAQARAYAEEWFPLFAAASRTYRYDKDRKPIFEYDTNGDIISSCGQVAAEWNRICEQRIWVERAMDALQRVLAANEKESGLYDLQFAHRNDPQVYESLYQQWQEAAVQRRKAQERAKLVLGVLHSFGRETTWWFWGPYHWGSSLTVFLCSVALLILGMVTLAWNRLVGD